MRHFCITINFEVHKCQNFLLLFINSVSVRNYSFIPDTTSLIPANPDCKHPHIDVSEDTKLSDIEHYEYLNYEIGVRTPKKYAILHRVLYVSFFDF